MKPSSFCVDSYLLKLLHVQFLRWKYTRTILGDGNFKQDHIAMKNDYDDVAFSDGMSYMVGKENFNVYMGAVDALKKERSDKKKDNSVCIARPSLMFGFSKVS